MMRSLRLPSLLLSLFSFAAVAQPVVSPLGAGPTKFKKHDHSQGAFVVREIDGKTSCREASPAEALAITARRNVPLRVFGEERGPVRANASAGLNIILRGTAQLDANPQAKAAFERAAQIWEERIANPITVYVDVDFGDDRFGEPFEDGVIASADSDDYYGDSGSYGEIRAALVARAHNAAETAIYAALPNVSLPTDLGTTSDALAPSIQLRALGALPATAENTDSAPSIGFNNAFAYDFDPSNGISPGQKDFEGVVVHEIGHMLGFVSTVGYNELGAEFNAPSILDYFRFRPGVTSGSFGTAQRIQSSGGTHVYFAGASALALSTGRPDGEGGDERQASHWKDDDLSGSKIGIMDPTLGSAERAQLTQADLDAFGVLGYDVVSAATCAEAEPNETVANATTLSLGVPCTGSVSNLNAATYTITFSGGATDTLEDLFKITVPSSGKIKGTLTFSPGTADLDLYLFTISGANLTVLASANGSTTTEEFETATNLNAGTYYLAVTSYDGSSFTGNASYTLTVTSSGTQVPATPAAPTNLNAQATGQTTVNLTWTDNATNETAYVVEGRVGNSGYAEIGTVAANAAGATISGLVANTTYTFRVKARNGSTDSAPSNEASATTFGNTTTCTPSSTVACLLSNRFRVSVAYLNQFAVPPQPGNFQAGRLLQGVQNPDVGLFGFSSATAVEVLVRIQDARPFAPRFDVYYGGMTDVEYTVSVTDTQTGVTKTYRNPPGTVGGGVDRSTFPAN
jgi:Fibronectin type III domain/Bacterial pre-peptidase C-terminal domain